MKILSIETSCDETGISILEGKNLKEKISLKVLANSLSSQIKIHAPYGGVYPMLAKREHIKNLPILLEKVLKKVEIKSPQSGSVAIWRPNRQVDLIAVTSGPGLEPALWTGIVFAKELAQKWNIPLIPVNHMEGHIFSVFGKTKGEFKVPLLRGAKGGVDIDFPILSLLISGGHTELVLVKDFGKYQVIGETLDDAAGEAFDKVARMLGLPYPGGPEISKLAEIERKKTIPLLRGGAKRQVIQILKSLQTRRGGKKSTSPGIPGTPQKENFSLPRPMLYSKNFDFSFSGLKTAVLYLIQKIAPLNEEIKGKIAMEFENAVVETLIYKTKKAIEKYKVKTLIVAGGVSANKYLRKEIKKNIDKKIKILFPDKKLTTDNSIMIGIAGYLEFIKNLSADKAGKVKVKKISDIKAEGNLRL